MANLSPLVKTAPVPDKIITADQHVDTAALNNYIKIRLPAADHPLAEAAAHHFAKPGKLLRAKMALRASTNLNITPSVALPWAAAIELLHNASLIHDDICDGDTLRRGRPSVWFKFGRDIALMLGDWLIALSFELASEAAQLSATPVLVQILSDQMKLTTVGEARGLDVQGTLDWNGYVDLAADKTAPLLTAPLRGIMAMDHGGTEQGNTSTTVDAYFRCLGSAYQIANDILNFQGNDGAETQASDLGRRAPNAVTLLYRHVLDEPDQIRFDEWYRSGCNSALNSWQNRIIESSAMNTASRRMHDIFNEGGRLAEELPEGLNEVIHPLYLMVKQICEKSVMALSVIQGDVGR